MKAHFLNSAEPVRERGSLQGLCGEIVEDAAFADAPLDIDGDARLEFNPLRDCMKCVRKGFPLRYLSRIVPAGSLKNNGGDE